MGKFSLHPAALSEYTEAADFYVCEASKQVAEAFVEAVESAIEDIASSPIRWPVIQHPQIRRYILKKFPYALYYKWNSGEDSVVIYAVMHCSRKPNSWRDRL